MSVVCLGGSWDQGLVGNLGHSPWSCWGGEGRRRAATGRSRAFLSGPPSHTHWPGCREFLISDPGPRGALDSLLCSPAS